MLVKTPALKLGVEIRDAKIEGERIAFTGVAGVMPCSVELTPQEALALARRMMAPPILRVLVRSVLSRSGKGDGGG
jgi:hypothetical protein